MTIELRITPPAAQDMRDAYTWYEQQQLGLGEAFLLRLEARLEAIRRMPERFERVHRNFRRALVRRYPYAIFFEHDGSAATVYSIVHTAQDARKWRDRLP